MRILDPLKAKALACLWKSKVPSKILIFCLSVILNKLLTRVKLAKLEIIEGVHNVIVPCVFWKRKTWSICFVLVLSLIFYGTSFTCELEFMLCRLVTLC